VGGAMIHITHCTLFYGQTQLAYDVLKMPRQSLEIAVHPDKSIFVKAPLDATNEAIEAKIKKRFSWIIKQINYFKQFSTRTSEKYYVGGASHLYLGRHYRLKITPSLCDKILLKRGYFYIDATYSNPEHIKKLLENWYKKQAKIYLSKLFETCWESINLTEYQKPLLKIQTMHKRWGSLSRKGQLTLNARLIQAPKECIEYVIIHELCHLVHHNHGAEFYHLLERIMPDWIKRKHKLEMALI
jgi:predicted metal-dependent hydrolase